MVIYQFLVIKICNVPLGKTVKGKKNFSDLEEISENNVFDVFKTVFQKDKKDLFKYAYRHVELKQFL